MLHEPGDEPGAEYLEELRHFLECVDGHAAPLVGGRDAARTLEVVLAAANAATVGGVRP